MRYLLLFNELFFILFLNIMDFYELSATKGVLNHGIMYSTLFSRRGMDALTEKQARLADQLVRLHLAYLRGYYHAYNWGHFHRFQGIGGLESTLCRAVGLTFSQEMLNP